MKELYKLLLNIFIPIILALLLNFIIFSLQWNNSEKYYNPYLPKGYIIGIIWTLIFGLLGAAHYILIFYNKNKSSLASSSIIFLIAFCLAYPFLTNGLKYNKISNILNFVTLVLSIIVSIIVFRKSIYAFYFLIPILIWSLYVNYATIIIPNDLMN